MGKKLLLIPLALPLVAVFIIGSFFSFGGSSGSDLNPGQATVGDIPTRVLALCLIGAEKYSPDVPWEVICGVLDVETDHGRANLPGVTSGENSLGCCSGIAQFNRWEARGGPLTPARLRADETNRSTWGMWSVDGDGDGWKDVFDYDDAILSAARYLQHGTTLNVNDCPSVQIGDYGSKVKRGIFTYNNSCHYVRRVLESAHMYRTLAERDPLPGTVFQPPNLGTPNAYGYYAMPPSINGAYTIYSLPCRRYGSLELVSVLYTVANRWKQFYPEGWVNIGDLNAGWPHNSHKWGVAVDLDATTNGADWAADYTKGGYNRQATVLLGQLFLDTGLVKNIWYNDTFVVSALLQYAQNKGIRIGQIKPLPGHDNHFHVDINTARGPLHAPSC